MKIAVLDLTTHPLPLLAGLPRVYEQIITWLSQTLPEADYVGYDIAESGADLPEPADFDGLVVSGSEFGVYDDTPWMAPLRQLLLDAKAANKPIYGICFGHQIMADTFGGKAEKAAQGMHMGARKFTIGEREIDAFARHQDQVTEVPPKARVTGAAAHCPVAALTYDFPAESIQFHPEYREGHLRELYDRFLGTAVSAAQRSDALKTFETADVPPDIGAADAAAFFRKHLG